MFAVTTLTSHMWPLHRLLLDMNSTCFSLGVVLSCKGRRWGRGGACSICIYIQTVPPPPMKMCFKIPRNMKLIQTESTTGSPPNVVSNRALMPLCLFILTVGFFKLPWWTGGFSLRQKHWRLFVSRCCDHCCSSKYYLCFLFLLKLSQRLQPFLGVLKEKKEGWAEESPILRLHHNLLSNIITHRTFPNIITKRNKSIN